MTEDQRDQTPQVVSVTNVASSEADDQSARIKRYLLTMGIRTTCFILLVVIDNWVRWLFLLGAAVLPYLAVVLANARSPRVQGEFTGVVPAADDTKHLGA